MSAKISAKISFLYRSVSGATFSVTPSLVTEIETLINTVRDEIAAQRASRNFVGYLSVPVSSKSGGDRDTNICIATHITDRVRTEFGQRLWLVNPAAYSLSKDATGGDYMAVWSDVLAGIDGTGSDFDLAYFVGPSDVWEFFAIGNQDRLGTIEQWLANRAKTSAAYKKIYDDLDSRQRFIRYYGLRGSTIFSKGAHDEWNIVVALNAKRSIGEDIAVYFDGKPVEPGDYQDSVDSGNETVLH